MNVSVHQSRGERYDIVEEFYVAMTQANVGLTGKIIKDLKTR